MSPPIRDGSGDSIGSIRLGDGTEISEVRTGAGDVLFSGSAIPDGLVDNFEDADSDPAGVYGSGDDLFTYYTVVRGAQADWSRTTNNPVADAKSLEITQDTVTRPIIASDDGDGLNQYPAKGDVFSAFIRITSSSNNPGFLFGANIGNDTAYALTAVNPNNEIRLLNFSSLSGNSVTDLVSAAVTLSDGTIFELEVEWHDGSGSETDNTIVSRIYDVNQSTLARQSELANFSVSDSDYATQRGVGWVMDAGTTGQATVCDEFFINGSV